MRALQVIESAYRCTIEEQDDPAIWITHAMKGAGAELAVLLRGNAVNYAVKGQDASGLAFGALEQSQPPRLDRDVAGLIEKGVNVYIVEEDLAERGIPATMLVPGVSLAPRGRIASIFDAHDQIWHW